MSGVYSYELEFDVLVSPPATLVRPGPQGHGVVRIVAVSDEQPPRDEFGMHYLASSTPDENSTTDDEDVPIVAYALKVARLLGYGHLVTDVGAAPVWLGPETAGLWLAAHQTRLHQWGNLPFRRLHNHVRIELESQVTRRLERSLDGDPRHHEFMRLIARGMERRARRRAPKFVRVPKW